MDTTPTPQRLRNIKVLYDSLAAELLLERQALYAAIRQAHEEGMTFAAIAAVLGLSRQRCEQICKAK